MMAVRALLDLTGFTEFGALAVIRGAGFTFLRVTKGGYHKYVHEDGSQIWIRPNGEVIRLGPKVRARDGKKYHPRFDQHGNATKLHSTGEYLR